MSAHVLHHKPACKKPTELKVTLDNQLYFIGSDHTCKPLLVTTLTNWYKKTFYSDISRKYSLFIGGLTQEGIQRGRNKGVVVERPSVNRCLSTLISYQVLSKQTNYPNK